MLLDTIYWTWKVNEKDCETYDLKQIINIYMIANNLIRDKLKILKLNYFKI